MAGRCNLCLSSPGTSLECYRACKNAVKWALEMSGVSLIGEDRP